MGASSPPVNLQIGGTFSDIIDGIGELSYRGYEPSAQPAATTANNSSTFCGWRTPIGVPVGPFNFCDVGLNIWDVNAIPTVIQIQVLDTTNTGTVLASGTASLAGIRMNSDTIVRINLNTTVNTTNQVVVRWWTDGHIGILRLASLTFFNTPTYAQSGYCTNTSGNITTTPTWVDEGGQNCDYVRIGLGACISQADSGTATNTFAYTNNVETAYGSAFGTQSPFNRVEFDIQTGTTVAKAVPTTFRVRFRQSNAIGTSQTSPIVCEKIIKVLNIGLGQTRRIVFNLPTIVQGQYLWCEVMADGGFALRQLATGTYPTGSGYAQSTYMTTASIDSTSASWANDGTQHNMYARLSLMDWNNYQPNGTDAYGQDVQTQAASLMQPFPLIPRNLYGVTGREMTLFFDPSTGYPAMHETMRDQPYDNFVTCTKGTTYLDRWSYTPVDGDAGTLAFQLDTSFRGIKMQTQKPTLNFCTLANGSAVTRKILTIGDSLNGGSPGSDCIAEMIRLSATGTNVVLSFQGINSGALAGGSAVTTGIDSTGATQNIKAEAWPGKTADFFYTNVASPFAFSGSFDFSKYLTPPAWNSGTTYAPGALVTSVALTYICIASTTNQVPASNPGQWTAVTIPTLSSNDWVEFDLGTNDIFNAPTDAACFTSIQTYLTDIDAMITNIKANVSGIRIAISLPYAWAGQDGFAYTYGNNAQTAFRARRNRDMLVREALAHYDTSTQNTAKIYVTDAHCALDPVNGFGQSTVTQGQYNPTTKVTQNNSVHLQQYEVWRRAARKYAFFKNLS